MHYWHLSAARSYDLARVRLEYRRIEAEKKRLLETGVDSELIRLLCRHLVNLQNRKGVERFWQAYMATKQGELFAETP